MMRELRKKEEDKERIVVVANSTAVLELVAKLCDKHGWPWIQLDGKTSAKPRTVPFFYHIRAAGFGLVAKIIDFEYKL